MTPERASAVAILGVGVMIALYYATSNDGRPNIIPDVQTEAQVMGLGVQAGMRVNPNTPLDLSFETHFWAPGQNPRDQLAIGLPTIKAKVSYPSVPGGNTSTVMHKGWSQFSQISPESNKWFLNPPSAAVL